MLIENLTDILLAGGALGTASFGFVEAFKWWRFGEYGYPQLKAQLGTLMSAMEEVYSPTRVDGILRTLYRGNPEDLVRFLRQGVRAGLTINTIPKIVKEMPSLDAGTLTAAAQSIHSGIALTDEQRMVLGKYELAADARIEGAILVAQSHYAGKLRLTAAVFAIVIALVAAFVLLETADNTPKLFGSALLIGVLAVPIAPIVNDLVNVLKSVATAIGPKP